MLQTKKESRKHRKRGIAIERCVRSVDALFGRSKLDFPVGRMASRSTRKQWDNCISVKPQNVDMLDILFSKTRPLYCQVVGTELYCINTV